MTAVQSCTKCGRANPPAGAYCHSCGVALGNSDRQAVAAGSRPFNSPFVFPAGRTCRNFDELALACQEDWKTACGLLKDGYLESFLGGLGRLDLVHAAKEAARFPDLERGLDQLLGQLPTAVLAEPKLRVDPVEVSLGVVDSSQARRFNLELDNQGKRLLYGKVTSDALWLTIGDAGANEKAFHFTDEEKISVSVRPEHVRAGNKPVEGKLVVSSNAGVITVNVRAEKPVKAFSGGPLTGAKSPREIAEKAKNSSKEVAPFFENGDVEKWYAVNGWVYPVKVPAASGLAAIQQFFEALGLTKPPKVEIDKKFIALNASPGDQLKLSVEVSTADRKAVFAHVTSSEPWLEIGKPNLSGKVATVPISIASVPNRPGETLQAELTVISNGNARWVLPVTLEVAGNAFDFGGGGQAAAFTPGGAFDFSASEPPQQPPPPPSVPPMSPPLETSTEPPLLTPLEEVAPSDFIEPAPPKSSPTKPPPAKPAVKGPPVDMVSMTMHAMPAILLVVALVSVVLYDRLRPLLVASSTSSGTTTQILGPRYDPNALVDKRPRVGVNYTSDGKFGVVRLDEGAPTNKAAWKRLTYSENGDTNSTMVKINGSEYRFGELNPGRDWVAGFKANDLKEPYYGRQSVFRFRNDDVDVTQYIQVVPGQTSALDTVLIYYRVRNMGTVPRKVEMRLLLDTFIGDNDGVPFLVPGKSEMVRLADLKDKEVPEYLEVIENPNDPKNPGTIVRLGLKGIRWGEVEPTEPGEVVIGQMGNARSWRPLDEKITNDSAVAVYWPEREVKPKEIKHYAITYGLGSLEVSNDLGITAPGSVMPNRDFTVTGYVYKAKKGQTVKLEVPAGMEIVDGADKTIAADSDRAQVFWTLRSKREGKYELNATTKGTQSKPLRIVVKSSSIFG